MKRILAFTLVLMLALSTVCFAAVSSSGRSSSSRPSTSAPSVKSSTQQAAPSSGYKPSAPAKSYSDQAPSTQKQTTAVPNNNNAQSSSGGFFRNAGLFGGGFLMGSLFSSLFGYGHMPMSPMMGGLVDIVFLVVLVMAIRYLWNRFIGRNDRNMR